MFSIGNQLESLENQQDMQRSTRRYAKISKKAEEIININFITIINDELNRDLSGTMSPASLTVTLSWPNEWGCSGSLTMMGIIYEL